jgi:multiple sugar transport system substrate-binding protein
MAGPVFSRRRILGMFGIAATAVVTACAGPPAAPTEPAKPTAAPTPAEAAKPTAAPTTAPAATATTASQAAAKPTEAPKPTAAPAQPTATPAEAAKPQPTPTAPPPQLKTGQKLITVMYNAGSEWPQDLQDKYEQANQNVRIYLVAPDLTGLIASTAAGSPPDIFRLQAPEGASFRKRKMMKDLNDYFKQSTILKIDDLATANMNYMYAGDTVGKGNLYGMVKDWSPDLTLFANKKLFDAAKVPLPSDETAMTYADIPGLAASLTKKAGDRTEVMGFAYEGGWIDRQIEFLLNTEGKSLWESDFSKIHLTTPEAKKAVDFFYQLSKNNITFNPLNPSTSWNGDQFTKNQVALIQYGYWFSGMAESDDTKGNVVILPSPKWGTQHKSPTITATGTAVHAKTKNPDEAWKVFEWYSGGEPALVRAKSGWGVPGLKSMYQHMPTDTPFRKQVQKVLQAELAMSDVAVRYNPWILQTEQAGNPFRSSWAKNLEAALRNQITFDQLVTNVEKDVNDAIKEGMDKYG